jgi:hypothetical protein
VAADVISACLAYYDSLSFSGRPPIYFAEAPAKTDAGATLLPPYTVLLDDGTTSAFTEELVPIETTKVRFHCYAKGLADAVATARGIKYDQGAPDAREGFDFAPPDDFPLDATAGVLLDGGLVRTAERRFVTPDRLDGTRVHMVELSYILVVRIGDVST